MTRRGAGDSALPGASGGPQQSPRSWEAGGGAGHCWGRQARLPTLRTFRKGTPCQGIGAGAAVLIKPVYPAVLGGGSRRPACGPSPRVFLGSLSRAGARRREYGGARSAKTDLPLKPSVAHAESSGIFSPDPFWLSDQPHIKVWTLPAG